MNTQQYKIQLAEEKKLLESELADLGKVGDKTGEWEATPEAQTMPEADENDLADRSEDFGERTGTLSALNARLDDINRALASIEEGTYGTCEVCGKPIEEDRLEANPAAPTCKECMEK
ncbi:MAG: TraR/DksA C4-type zinc finger protein [Patescibacteria group bacterium]